MINLHNWKELANKKVLVRIDGNVPLTNGVIDNAFRLHAVLPTLQFLQERGAQITIITHLGRPKNYEPELSTKPLQQWFDATQLKVTVLENLRFDPREQEPNKLYAQELADDFDYFVQDAWGVLHRHDTSVTLLPACFAPEKRSFGFLVEKELKQLKTVKNNPAQPYLVFLGGGKGDTKLEMLEKLVHTKKPTTIIVLPALCFTFFKALGKPVGASLVDEQFVPRVQELLQKAQEAKIELLFPIDVTYLEGWHGPLKICDIEKLPTQGIGMGIGPKSLEFFKTKISSAKTIFFNGAMGITDRPETLESTDRLLEIIAEAKNAYRVIGGGNSVAEVEKLRLLDQVNFCSTGGGSTLAYIKL